MHITLYRKYRPSSFEEISGETEIVKSLKLSLRNNAVSHAYLFSGPRGVGKTTTARLIAKGVNCLNLKENGEPCNTCKNCTSINEGNFYDLIEIDAASNRSIDEIRALKEKINYQPSEGKKKVYIIDEAHMLTKEAFNALLKTLEEPPAHVIFILATTEFEKILPTIVSRCQRYDFKKLSLEEMKLRLNYILEQEHINMEDTVFPIIYENSSGSMRDAISILERLIISSNDKYINLNIAENTLGITPSERIKEFLSKLLKANEYDIMDELEDIAANSFDLELFFKDLAKHIKNLMLKNEFETNLGFSFISIIYDILTKFKFEDDKKLVGYVIVAEILKLFERKTKQLKTAQVEESNSDFILEKKEPKIEFNSNISIADIKNAWETIKIEATKIRISYRLFLMNAEPVSLNDGILTIKYGYDCIYIKEQMETQEYNEPFLKLIRDFFNENRLIIKYDLVGNKKSNDSDDSEFHKKIKNFFEGNE